MIGDLSKRQLLIVGAVGVIALAAIGAIGFTAMTGDTTPGEQADGAENPSADAESDLSSEDLPDGLTLDKGEVTVDESVLHSAHVEAFVEHVVQHDDRDWNRRPGPDNCGWC